MKYCTAIIGLILCLATAAQDGYQIKVTLKPFKNQYIYLGHYYGKQLPIIDSVKVDAQSTAVFKGPKKLGGGVYLVGYPDRSQHFEILVDKSQTFSIVADTANMDKLSITGSPENTAFLSYQAFMNKRGKALDALVKERQAAPKDSVALTAKMTALREEIKNYRDAIITKEPNTLLALMLHMMRDQE